MDWAINPPQFTIIVPQIDILNFSFDLINSCKCAYYISSKPRNHKSQSPFDIIIFYNVPCNLQCSCPSYNIKN